MRTFLKSAFRQVVDHIFFSPSFSLSLIAGMRQTYVKARKSRPVGVKRLVIERDELGYFAARQRTIISDQGAICHLDILAMEWKSAKEARR